MEQGTQGVRGDNVMELWLIFGLMVKHILADYFLQYGWMIREKGTYGAWGGIAHSGVHAVGTLIVLSLFDSMINIPLLFALFLSVADGVAHYHIDYVKSNFWKDRKLTDRDQAYWMAHGVDQFAHFVTYMVIVLCV